MRTRSRMSWSGSIGVALLAVLALMVPAGAASAQPTPAGHGKDQRGPIQDRGKVSAEFIGTDVSVGPNTGDYDTITDPDEVNRYRIDTGGGTIHAKISELPADYDMVLYAAAGSTPLAVSENEGTASEEINVSVGAGAYSLYVYSYSGTSADYYYLEVSFPPRDTSNSMGWAPPISSGAQVSETIWGSGDVDTWRLDTGPGIIDVNLDSLPADYDLRVLNANGAAIGRSDLDGLTSEHVSVSVPGGRYYIEVSGYNGASHGVRQYRMSLRVFQAPSAPTGLRLLTNKRKTVVVGWNGPASDGGLAIGHFEVRISTNKGRKWTGWMHRGLQAFVKGRHVRPRSPVWIEVVAVNAAGRSPAATIRFRSRR